MTQSRIGYLILGTLLSAILLIAPQFWTKLWFLFWFAPIPILLLTLSLPSKTIALPGFVLGAFSNLPAIVSQWDSPTPHSTWLGHILLSGILGVLFLIFFKKLYEHTPRFLCVFVFPALVIVMEWLANVWLGHPVQSAFSQVEFLPLVQVGAIAGIWGVSFLPMLFASAVSVALFNFKDHKQAVSALILAALILLLGLGFGFMRLNTPTSTERLPVGVISLPQTEAEQLSPQLAEKQVHRLIPSIEKLAASGAKVILLPEQTLTAVPETNQGLYQLLSNVARLNKVTLAIGLIDIREQMTRRNVIWLFGPDRKLAGTYVKQRPHHYFERGTIAGNKELLFSIGKTRLAILMGHDLITDEPADNYGQQQANILLVPTIEYGSENNLALAPALFAGVENGFSVVRNAQNGPMSLSNPYGQILAWASASTTKTHAIIWPVPTQSHETFYNRTGNWLPWLCLIFILLITCNLYRIKFKGKRPPKTDPHAGKLSKTEQPAEHLL